MSKRKLVISASDCDGMALVGEYTVYVLCVVCFDVLFMGGLLRYPLLLCERFFCI